MKGACRYQNCVFGDKFRGTELIKRSAYISEFTPLNPSSPEHKLFINRADCSGEILPPPFEYAYRYGLKQSKDFYLLIQMGKLAGQTVNHPHIHYIPHDADFSTVWNKRTSTSAQGIKPWLMLQWYKLWRKLFDFSHKRIRKSHDWLRQKENA